jgi:hypothetical protein
LSLQRFTEQGARITRVCLTRHSPLSGFRPSQRFSSPQSSRVFFTPERSWDSPFRAFPSRRAVAPLGARYPLVVIASRLPRSTPIFTPSGGKKRSGNPTSGSCSLLESVLPGLGVSQRLGSVLSWASPSSGLSSSSVTQSFRDCSSPVLTSLGLSLPGSLCYPLFNTHAPNRKYHSSPDTDSPRKAHFRVSIYRECSKSLSRSLALLRSPSSSSSLCSPAVKTRFGAESGEHPLGIPLQRWRLH